ncbi:hypothetical protein NDN08_006143 [Rhodosorus marinus]|uniref:Coatomer subunit epsilon n=1 Tax=Rhodosorus marinus TaxID=101924 RepID=A0AAV8UJV6_9RHOD|nr:hypothetical protein NDN08_006143 [Rhodosorus marinus]
MDEELFELKNYFYLGNFAAAIQEGTTLSVEDLGLKIDKDVYLFRVDIAKGNLDKVMSKVGDEAPLALRAVKLYATYLKDRSNSVIIIETIKEWMEDAACASNSTFLLMCAMIYAQEKDFDNALRLANKGITMEHKALKVQIFIAMDRVDNANVELEIMRREDEYATLTQLCSCWVNLASGGSAVQEALYTYQELLERHGSTEPLLNGVALCQIALNKYDDAERTLQEALGKNPNHPDTLANCIVCSTHKKKRQELVDRYKAQLETVGGEDHAWLNAEKQFRTMFDSAVASAIADA